MLCNKYTGKGQISVPLQFSITGVDQPLGGRLVNHPEIGK